MPLYILTRGLPLPVIVLHDLKDRTKLAVIIRKYISKEFIERNKWHINYFRQLG